MIMRHTRVIMPITIMHRASAHAAAEARRSWGNRERALQDLTDSIALYRKDHADGEVLPCTVIVNIK